MVITMAKLRMAHASTYGARMAHAWRMQAAWAKRRRGERERLNDGDNNGQATHGAHKPPWPKRDSPSTRGDLDFRLSFLLLQNIDSSKYSITLFLNKDLGLVQAAITESWVYKFLA